MIRPWGESARPPFLSTSRVIRNTLLRLVSMMSYQSSSAMSAVTPPPLRPALLTRTVRGPYRSTAARTTAATDSGERTSATMPSTSRPSSVRSAIVCLTSRAVRAHRKTRWPAWPSWRATSRPMPLVAPVIRATGWLPDTSLLLQPVGGYGELGSWFDPGGFREGASAPIGASARPRAPRESTAPRAAT